MSSRKNVMELLENEDPSEGSSLKNFSIEPIGDGTAMDDDGLIGETSSSIRTTADRAATGIEKVVRTHPDIRRDSGTRATVIHRCQAN